MAALLGVACGGDGGTAPADVRDAALDGAEVAPSDSTSPDVPPELLAEPVSEHGLIVALDAIPCLDWDTQTPEDNCNHHGSQVLVQPDGTVLAVWYHGKGEKSKDSRLLWAKKPKGADWQPWAVLFDDPGRAEGNPTLWRSEKTGELIVFFVTLYGESWDDGTIRALRSVDDGQTWSAPVTLRDELAWMTRNKPLRLSTGELLLPTYDEALYIPSFMISADDFVADWIEIPFTGAELIKHPHQIQPTVIQRADGTLFALLRNTNPVVPQYAWEMTSADAGRTWSLASASVIPNSSARLEMIRARRGVVALAFNNSVAGRCPLAVALSDDEGRTWSAVANVLDACVTGGGSYGYPSIAEDPTDGSFWLTYTHDRRTIGYVHVTETWVRENPAPLAAEVDR
jgi:predicted neuraminidase